MADTTNSTTNKMTNIRLYHKMEQLEKMVQNVQNTLLSVFRAVDYRDYIKQPLSNFTMMWKYDGVYYDNPPQFYETIALREGYTKTKQAFSKMCRNADRQRDMWTYHIQLIYAAKMKSNRWITAEGKILTSGSLTLIRGNPNNNKIHLTRDGESYVVSRSFGAYKTFVDPTIEGTTNLLFFDGFYGNCSIDNLAVADKSKSTKGLWEGQ